MVTAVIHHGARDNSRAACPMIETAPLPLLLKRLVKKTMDSISEMTPFSNSKMDIFDLVIGVL
jgi:hypothetical protein